MQLAHALSLVVACLLARVRPMVVVSGLARVGTLVVRRRHGSRPVCGRRLGYSSRFQSGCYVGLVARV